MSAYRDQIEIVLVRPLYGGNVGSVCRAMMNAGLHQLVIAGVRPEMDWGEARKMAYHASPVLNARRETESLAEAVAECGLVAGTSARLGLYRSHSQTPRSWGRKAVEQSAANRIAVVFGPEDSGLTNEELALCADIIQIPSAPEYTSLNLAQAVMVCVYEMYVASDQFEPSEEPSVEAPSALREKMFELWHDALMDIGFMKEDKATHMMMGLRRILSRGTLTENDVKILMGIARQAQWAAREERCPEDASPQTEP